MENPRGPSYNGPAMPHNPAPPLADQTIAIVGVGLIGGSIAAALQARDVARTVIGIGRNPQRLEQARQRGLLDSVSTDPATVAAADLVILCTPVDQIIADVRQLAPHCRPGTILTDAGSVKAPLCQALENLPAGLEFLGSHPLAGSEKQGFEYADAGLFAGRVCVLTPTDSSTSRARQQVAEFWQSLGADVREMSPEEHDRALAETSHLPHLVAAALAATLTPENAPLAATGFRDATRIASGDAELWTAILRGNAAELLQSLARFEETLLKFRTAVQSPTPQSLQALLQAARDNRETAVHCLTSLTTAGASPDTET